MKCNETWCVEFMCVAKKQYDGDEASFCSIAACIFQKKKMMIILFLTNADYGLMVFMSPTWHKL